MTIKKSFKGISWQNPVFNSLANIVNIPDAFVRFTQGLSHLPPYALRIRSNGVTNQFGGNTFFSLGKKILKILMQNTGLQPSHKVMEIGCGCGRTAFALAEYLENGNYFGWDIDKVSVQSCLNNHVFKQKMFH